MTSKIEKGKLIYLASPYSHPDKSVMVSNFEIVSKKAAELVSDGHVVFAPITYGHMLCEFKEMTTCQEFWMGFCLTYLERCDQLWVYMMPGWDVSKGVAQEIEFAKENGMPIMYLEIKTNYLTEA
jgi:hypothetical protein